MHGEALNMKLWHFVDETFDCFHNKNKDSKENIQWTINFYNIPVVPATLIYLYEKPLLTSSFTRHSIIFFVASAQCWPNSDESCRTTSPPPRNTSFKGTGSFCGCWCHFPRHSTTRHTFTLKYRLYLLMRHWTLVLWSSLKNNQEYYFRKFDLTCSWGNLDFCIGVIIYGIATSDSMSCWINRKKSTTLFHWILTEETN